MSNGPLEVSARPTRAGATGLLASADLPTADLTDELLRQFFFTGTAAAPTGLVGLELLGTHALLRSLVVAPALRSQGAGAALVAQAERYAQLQGVQEVYLLTTTAEKFFERRGYRRIDRGEAPDSIRSTREFADICPASSAFMVKHL